MDDFPFSITQKLPNKNFVIKFILKQKLQEINLHSHVEQNVFQMTAIFSYTFFGISTYSYY